MDFRIVIEVRSGSHILKNQLTSDDWMGVKHCTVRYFSLKCLRMLNEKSAGNISGIVLSYSKDIIGSRIFLGNSCLYVCVKITVFFFTES